MGGQTTPNATPGKSGRQPADPCSTCAAGWLHSAPPAQRGPDLVAPHRHRLPNRDPERNPMAYRTTILVRFGDEDHAGIVYYPRFFNFFHIAFEDFWNEQGFPYARILDHDRVGFPTVHVETDFRKPLRFGDRFEVDVWLEKIGEASATFRYRGRRQGESEDTATARLVVVCVNMDTWTPTPIPAPLRALLERNATPPP